MGRNPNDHRVTATVNEDTYQRMLYWSQKKNISINQYLNEAIDMMIAFENRDYPLATLEQARLNQLVDLVASIVSSNNATQSIIISGFDSLLGLTKGDNYLLNNEDGDI